MALELTHDGDELSELSFFTYVAESLRPVRT